MKISSDINDVKRSDKIVLPGQGSFKACKNGIDDISVDIDNSPAENKLKPSKALKKLYKKMQKK